MSDENFYYLRHTVSGVTSAVPAEEAAHLLTHEHFKKYYVVVDSPKDEVLSQPYQVDEDGGRIPLDTLEPIEDEENGSDK